MAHGRAAPSLSGLPQASELLPMCGAGGRGVTTPEDLSSDLEVVLLWLSLIEGRLNVYLDEGMGLETLLMLHSAVEKVEASLSDLIDVRMAERRQEYREGRQ